jgi:prepilin signal peptidase PulO-like enzyme (type II secretory pathway)
MNPPQAHIESDRPLAIEQVAHAARSVGNYSVAAAPTPGSAHTGGDSPTQERSPSLYPLGLIVTYIAVAAALATFVRGDAAWRTFMLDFMAGFFLVFSFFKLLDVRGFADAYQSYDILAMRSRAYALAYPFLELILGVAYLIRWRPEITNGATLALMLVSSVGVLRAVLDRRRIRCACLGTALNLPMTTVTLAEDLGMAAMAAVALVWHH